MTDPTRGARQRRTTRRPGWLLLSVLLVLAIVASSALVFTNEVELLKLAVILALWAAVVAAFISFIYRRQSDIDQARARDLKLVYDLQLDREISARREYELSVESQLRRELSSELRAQASDEVASLRAELAALRANLEIIFDTDLQHRPALETERTAVHTFGRVISSRLDAEDREDFEPNTDESPIIDVPVEPHPPDHEWKPSPAPGGAHRRPSEPEPADAGWRPADVAPPRPRASERVSEPELRYPWLPPEEPAKAPPTPRPAPTPTPARAAAPPPNFTPAPPPPAATPAPPPPAPKPEPPVPTPEPERVGRHAPAAAGWTPAPAEGQFIPAGEPGSNWVSPRPDNGVPSVTPTPQSEPTTASPPPVVPAMVPPPIDPLKRKFSTAESNGAEAARRAKHSATGAADPGRPTPTLATPPQPPAAPPPPQAPEPRAARHRGADEEKDGAGQHVGGQSVSELLARLQVGSTEGGRRRRRED